jgi:NhaP-type Na+/H+ or K+/H+ antiporter
MIDLESGIAETAVLLIFGYISFVFGVQSFSLPYCHVVSYGICAAESVHMSGIVASLFCGVGMNHYTRRVLTRDGKLASTAVFKMLAHLAETAIFFQVWLHVSK